MVLASHRKGGGTALLRLQNLFGYQQQAPPYGETREGPRFKWENFYEKEGHHSCLRNLFMNQLTGVVEDCKFRPIPTGQDFIFQLSAQKFLLYQANPEWVTIDCGHERRSVNFQGLRRLVILPGCRVNSGQFAFDGEVDDLLQDDSLAPHFQIALNFSMYLLKGVGDEELDAVMEELLLLGSLEGIKVRDIGAIVRSSRGQALFRIGISVVTGGITLIGAYCCCYCLCSQNV